jgi:hypothetical protein
MLIVAYARDSVLAWEWVARQDELKLAVGVLGNAAGLFVATTAAWCWYWAFAELNKELWANWHQRIVEINHSSASNTNRKLESPIGTARHENDLPG